MPPWEVGSVPEITPWHYGNCAMGKIDLLSFGTAIIYGTVDACADAKPITTWS